MPNYFSPKEYFEGPMVYDWVHLLPISAGAKLLFAKLAYMADEQETAWPSQSYLAKYMNISISSVRRYIIELKECGVLDVNQRGLRRSNVYRFVISQMVFECIDSCLSLNKTKEKKLKELLSISGFEFAEKKDIDQADVNSQERAYVNGQERAYVNGPIIIEKNKGKEQSKRTKELNAGEEKNDSIQFENSKKEAPVHNYVVPGKFALVGFDQTLSYEKILFKKHRGADAEAVKEAMSNYATYRIELGAPITKSQLTAMRSEMELYESAFVVRAIQRAIANGWRGVNFASLSAEEKREAAYKSRQTNAPAGKEYAYERIKRTEKELGQMMAAEYMQSDDPRDHMTVQQLKELEWAEKLKAKQNNQKYLS